MEEADKFSRATPPFLRWAGSKRQLVPQLAKHWNQSYERYIEPFAGSAALFFNISPKQAILADINAELIGVYGQIKRNMVRVIDALKGFPKNKMTYYELRAMDPGTLEPAMRAARFIYLNRYCFNGLYRTNQKGLFNVPYSGRGTGGIPSIELFKLCSSKLRRASLIAGDFEKTLQLVRDNDFVYLDPPFRIKARRVFNEYDATSFGENDILRLRKCLLRLDRRGIAFLVSYADSEEARFLAKGFCSQLINVKRNIAGFAGNRKMDTELLIYNHMPKKTIFDEGS